MFYSTLVILTELVNTNKACKNTDGLLNTLKFVHKMSVDVTKLRTNNFNVFNNPSMFLNALLIVTESLKMIKIDRNTSEV
jgi:hypothetical protein